MDGWFGAPRVQEISLLSREPDNRDSSKSNDYFMNASHIKLLPILLLFLGTVVVSAQNPTEKELVP